MHRPARVPIEPTLNELVRDRFDEDTAPSKIAFEISRVRLLETIICADLEEGTAAIGKIFSMETVESRRRKRYSRRHELEIAARHDPEGARKRGYMPIEN